MFNLTRLGKGSNFIDIIIYLLEKYLGFKFDNLFSSIMRFPNKKRYYKI